MLTKIKLPTAEELLGDYTRRLDRHRDGRRALWLHLSRLEPVSRHPSEIRLAANLLRPLARRFQGEVFVLASGDIVVCLKDPEQPAIDAALFDVRFTFAKDALMQRAESEGEGVYLTVYDVAHDYGTFAATVKRACAGSEPIEPVPPKAEPQESGHLILSKAEIKARGALPGHVETSQGRIAIERLLERQTIARLEDPRFHKRWGVREHVRDQALDAFDSLSTSVARHQMTKSQALAEIERTLLPGWIGLLNREGTARHILLLHADALMSPEFLTLDRWLEEKARDRPAIGFLFEDAASDAGAIDYLRGFLSERGYKYGFVDVPVARLSEARLSGMKFIEIRLGDELPSDVAARLSRVVSELGEEAVLATNVATPALAESVFKAGIRLATGSAIRA